MKVVSAADLTNKTTEVLKGVMNGEPVIVTYRGKPAAAITPLSKEDLEDFVLEYSPKIRRIVRGAEAERKAGRILPLDEYLGGPSFS